MKKVLLAILVTAQLSGYTHEADFVKLTQDIKSFLITP